jgi:uncharacterized repeat protein (TIGR03803 family)
MKRIVSALGKLKSGRSACAVFLTCVATAIALPAQTLTTLFSFDDTDGYWAIWNLVQATNGDLYGTTANGGANLSGTVFKITLGGTQTTLYSFCSQSGCSDGQTPEGPLIQTADGNLYGVTAGGGANGYGTVFKITPSGTLTTLASLGNDGSGGPIGIVRATDGSFYGTEYGLLGPGAVFRVTPSGRLTTLYVFCLGGGPGSPCPDGAGPESPLIQATDGNFYGTTEFGGANGYGTVYKITPRGKLTTLYSFCSESGCSDGEYPWAAVVQATDGNLYGTTSGGGANGAGTVFRITPGGTLTTLYSFCSQSGCMDGSDPMFAAMVQATDGNLYGTTGGGGANGDGTVFRITTGGTLTTLYSFCSQSACADGEIPWGGLVQDTSGEFYGTTRGGGADATCFDGCGTVFSLSVGLGPFVETRPTSGAVGKLVEILGTDLTGATSVTFNGTAAAFKVVSSSLITTKVPPGATTGKVEVVTPGGTLSSNVPFRVP